MTLLPVLFVIELILSSIINVIKPINRQQKNLVYVILILLLVCFTKISGIEVIEYWNIKLSDTSWLTILFILATLFSFLSGKKRGLDSKILPIVAWVLIPDARFIATFFLLYFWSNKYLNELTKKKLLGSLFVTAVIILSSSSPSLQPFGNYLFLGGFSLYFLKAEYSFQENLFYGVLISVSSTLIPLNSWVIFLYLIPILVRSAVLSNKAVTEKVVDFDDIWSLMILGSISLSLVGQYDLFIFFITFVLIARAAFKLKDKENLSWFLLVLLFSISPPFGLGYELKIELLEAAWLRNEILLLPIMANFLIIQFSFMLLFFSKTKENIESIKEGTYKFDYLGVIILSTFFLTSLLFLPNGWAGDFSFYFYKFFGKTIDLQNRMGFGYYLFWVELGIWSVLVLLYVKTGPKFWERMRFKISKLDQNKDSSEVIERKVEDENTSFSVTELINSFNKHNFNVKPDQYHLIILIIFCLILLGCL